MSAAVRAAALSPNCLVVYEKGSSKVVLKPSKS